MDDILPMIKTPTAKVPCGSCRACCSGPNHMTELGPMDDPRNYKIRAVVSKITGKQTIALQNDDQGNCIYLKAEGCSIYSERPAVCRLYDCRVMPDALLDPHIREARDALMINSLKVYSSPVTP